MWVGQLQKTRFVKTRLMESCSLGLGTYQRKCASRNFWTRSCHSSATLWKRRVRTRTNGSLQQEKARGTPDTHEVVTGSLGSTKRSMGDPRNANYYDTALVTGLPRGCRGKDFPEVVTGVPALKQLAAVGGWAQGSQCKREMNGEDPHCPHRCHSVC